nr:ATP-dependent RNA helicase [Andalucia godoyi]|eukprot:ANDGO_06441.mRNA.1 DEAD-box ATP-dependent RNA helicase 18
MSAWPESISPVVREVLEKDFGFSKPTPVQTRSIDAFSRFKDVIAQATTGSGKTLAYTIPSIEAFLKRKREIENGDAVPGSETGVVALILAPTRELAQQIFAVVSRFVGRIPDLKLFLETGGGQANELHPHEVSEYTKCLSIIIGTPGRTKQLVETHGRLMNFKYLSILVLDEADRLFAQQFFDDVKAILGALPKQRRTGLFSATLEQVVQTMPVLSKLGVRNPEHIVLKLKKHAAENKVSLDSLTPENLGSFFLEIELKHKLGQLVHLLRNSYFRMGMKKTLLYCSSGAMVEYLSAILPALLSVHEIEQENAQSDAGTEGEAEPVVECLSFHGKLVQKKRNAHLQRFVNASKDDPPLLLVCTDVAARGLDFVDIPLVVQFDMPSDPDAFIHRIGRTARAGKQGVAICFLTKEEDAFITFLANRFAPALPLPKTSPLFPSVPNMDEFADRIVWSTRSIAYLDRAVYEDSVDAYVSFVRAYKEHKLSYVFPFSRLDFGALAVGLGLLRLPKMGEMHKLPETHPFISSFTPPAFAFEEKDIKFKDSRRQAAFERKRERVEEERAERQKDAKRMKHENKDKETDVQRKLTKKERERIQRRQAEKDLDEINTEARLLKKLRAGKITEKEYENLSEL